MVRYWRWRIVRSSFQCVSRSTGSLYFARPRGCLFRRMPKDGPLRTTRRPHGSTCGAMRRVRAAPAEWTIATSCGFLQSAVSLRGWKGSHLVGTSSFPDWNVGELLSRKHGWDPWEQGPWWPFLQAEKKVGLPWGRRSRCPRSPTR